MKLDYIDNMNEYGDSVVRLYDFDKTEADKFRAAIHQTIITDHQDLNLASLQFIQSRNCNLTLRISDKDHGIVASDNSDFFCYLTHTAYTKIILLIKPFCKKQTKGYQWLYDIDSPVDFLFSPAGTW